MATPNLNLDHIAEGQTNKETTANEAFDGLDQSMNTVRPIAITGDVVITEIQLVQTQLFALTGTPGATFVLTIPDTITKAFSVFNGTDSECQIEIESAGSDITALAAGSAAILHTDGSQIYDIGGGTSAGGGGGGTTITVEDEGGSVSTPTNINFVGGGVNASENSDGTVDITIPAPPTLPSTTVTEETGDFEVSNADLGGNVIKEVNNASDVFVFVEAGLTGVEPLTLIQTGAGAIVIEEASGVSIRSRLGGRTAGRYSALSLVPAGSDAYYLIGDLTE